MWNLISFSHALIVGMILGLVGCSTLGDPFDLENARLVQNGMNREEVIQIMGSEPSGAEGTDEGKLTWLFSYANPISFGTQTERVSFRLDEHGRVYGIPKGGVQPEIEY